MPRHIQNLGGDEAAIGIIMGSFGVAVLVALPWVSRRIDLHGCKPFMLAGVTLMALSTLGFAFLGRIDPLFVLLRLLQGLAFAMMFNAATTAVTWCVPSNRLAQGLGIFGAFVVGAHAVGPAVGEAIVAKWGFVPFFPVAASFSLVALFLFLRIPWELGRGSVSSGEGLLRLILRRELAAPLCATVLSGAGFGSTLSFLAAYAASMNLKISTFFISYAILVMGVRTLGGRASDLLGRHAVLLPGFCLGGLALAGLAWVHSSVGLSCVGAFFGIGHGILYPTLNALVVDRTRPEERGTAMGSFNASFNFGTTFFAFGFGVIAKYFGFPVMYVVSGIGLWAAAARLAFDWFKSSGGKR